MLRRCECRNDRKIKTQICSSKEPLNKSLAPCFGYDLYFSYITRFSSADGVCSVVKQMDLLTFGLSGCYNFVHSPFLLMEILQYGWKLQKRLVSEPRLGIVLSNRYFLQRLVIILCCKGDYPVWIFIVSIRYPFLIFLRNLPSCFELCYKANFPLREYAE